MNLELLVVLLLILGAEFVNGWTDAPNARWGIPTSESHALVSGLAGAGLASGGPSVFVWAGWQKVLFGLLFSSFLGFGGGFSVMLAIYWLFRKAVPGRVQGVFR